MVTIVLSHFEPIFPQQVERPRAGLRHLLEGSLTRQSKEQLHPVCHGWSAPGLNGLYSKTQHGVFSLHTTIQAKTLWLLNTAPALFTQNKNVRALALSHLPSHLKTVKTQWKCDKSEKNCCPQYPALPKNEGRKRQSNGITHSISCEVPVVANDGDERSGFTVQKAQTSV